MERMIRGWWLVALQVSRLFYREPSDAFNMPASRVNPSRENHFASTRARKPLRPPRFGRLRVVSKISSRRSSSSRGPLVNSRITLVPGGGQGVGIVEEWRAYG